MEWSRFDISPILHDKWIVTIGNFDGVHLGHQFLINQIKQVAKKEKLNSAIISFYPHPQKLLSPQKIYEIYSFEKKKELIKSMGISALFFITFDKNVIKTSATDFILKIIKKLPIHSFLIGYDFVFGKDRKGNLKLIEKICSKLKIQVIQAKPLCKDNKIISSSFIKKLLLAGEFIKTKEYLGYEWQLQGKVRKGSQLAQKLGYPTANIKLNFEPPLKLGVYAVKVKVAGKWYQSIANYGFAPTLEKRKYAFLECHIFNFNKNIYNLEIIIVPISFLRGEIIFNKVDLLKKQIEKDIKMVSNIFTVL